MEHLRILEAMTKRILSIGKMHERKKIKMILLQILLIFLEMLKIKMILMKMKINQLN